MRPIISYYRDTSRLDPAARSAINYDHPDVLENSLLVTKVHAVLQCT